MSIIIRDAKSEDKSDIVELIKAFAKETGETSPITPAFVERYLASPSNYILVAEWNSHFAGLLSYSLRLDLWHAASCCYIEEIIVKEPFRGKGIGSALINFMLQKAKNEGYAEISLTVDQENARAQALYKRLGIDEFVVGLEKHM